MHYVKFLQLSSHEFAQLKYKDYDTLYFVYEADENTVELYLGNKLISSGNSGISPEGARKLSQLSDVAINEIQDRDILIYSDLYQQWVNAPVQDFMPIFIGTNGEVNGITGCVPAPSFTETNAFLSSNGKWEKIQIPIEELQEILSKEDK